MPSASLPFRSASALARLLRAGKVSARELLELCWARVEKFNPALNAIVVSDMRRAREAADAADRRLTRKEALGPLDGVPTTIKESFDWSGTPSTWGVPELARNIARTDAEAVERLTRAGAVIFGKTNVPLMLADWQSFNAIYGTTNNPWNLALSPGGSSGGSAAALAAGLSALEIGSDIGASIRNPAHYCGVYGHKPTYGIVPMRGHLFPGANAYSDISVGGPLARSAEDLELAMGLLAGPEGIEARGVRFSLPKPRARKLKDFRVAMMLTDPESEVDQPLVDRLSALADFLAPRVATFSLEARPAFTTAEAHETYIMLLRAATSGRQTDADFAANIEISKRLAPEDRSYFARMVRASILPHRAWLSLNHKRHAMRAAWDRFFQDYDVLLCPAAASAAVPHDQVGERYERTILVNGRRVPTTDQLFWAGYSGGYYLPSTVAPNGLTDAGLPVGVQIITAEREDLTSIAFARLLEREYCAFVPPPGYE
ncbi:MAG: amidase [Parvibaculaceae bacterium]